MFFKNILWSILILFCIVSFNNCKKEKPDNKEEPKIEEVVDEKTKKQNLEKIVQEVLQPNLLDYQFNKKMVNPFSLRIIQESVDSLVAWGYKSDTPYLLELSSTKVKPDKIYVRFEPQSNEELLKLNNDNSFPKFEFPIDYTAQENGMPYEEIPDGNFAYQYTVIEPNHQLPNVKYTILDSLYFPRDEMIELMSVALLFSANFDMRPALLDEIVKELLPDYDEVMQLYESDKAQITQKITKGFFSKLNKL